MKVIGKVTYPSKQEDDVRIHSASTKVPSQACDPFRIKAAIHGQSPGAEAIIVESCAGRSRCMWIGRIPHSLIKKKNVICLLFLQLYVSKSLFEN